MATTAAGDGAKPVVTERVQSAFNDTRQSSFSNPTFSTKEAGMEQGLVSAAGTAERDAAAGGRAGGTPGSSAAASCPLGRRAPSCQTVA